jgi:hypothetical protein
MCTPPPRRSRRAARQVRKIIAKYEVPEDVARQTERRVLRRARPCGEHDTSLSSRDVTTT